MRRAVFLDRDGTLIEDTSYVRDSEQVILLPDVVPALQRFFEDEFLLIVISNQSGIGRGWISLTEARLVHETFERLLALHGIPLQSCYYCPHSPEVRCNCRKPEPGLLFEAASDWNVDLANSVMIGDKVSDVEAGNRAGCSSILITNSRPADTVRGHWAKDWKELLRYWDTHRRQFSA